jgi:putative transposase
MPGPSAVSITISPPQQAILDRLLRQHSSPQALIRRIQIVLAAASGVPNEQIALQLGTSPKTVRRWRARWAAAQADLAAADGDPRTLRSRLAEILADAPRPGAPPTFTAEQIVQIMAIACTPPADSDRPIDAWTPRELADEAEKRHLVASISARSVGRFLKSGRPQAASQPLLAEYDGA